jgi:hypothetical protein
VIATGNRCYFFWEDPKDTYNLILGEEDIGSCGEEAFVIVIYSFAFFHLKAYEQLQSITLPNSIRYQTL